MFGVNDYGAFVAAFILLLIIPGPSNFAMITATGKGGLRGGMAGILGAMIADQMLLWLAVAGVAALLQAHPLVYRLVQWAGAGYLAWMGLCMLFSRGGAGAPITLKSRHYLRQLWLITLLNPKAIIFYIAFFPLFIDPATHQGVATFGFMALTVLILNGTYGLLVVLMTHRLAARMRARPGLSKGLERLAGSALVGFGVRMVLTG